MRAETLTAVASAPSLAPIDKLVVAVHGIGKQFRYATIQSVAVRFGAYCRNEGRMPLGSFHPAAMDKVGWLPFKPPPGGSLPPALTGVAFAEVFWADIPRALVQKEDTIEETKAWAETIVQRVRAMDCQKHGKATVDFQKTSAVVAEMIETIGVLENLLTLAKKAGFGGFDLAQLLDDFLGDVQIVTDFAGAREDILKEFDRVMSELLARHPTAKEIHVIAHSEGTVVAFMGMLRALSATTPPAWAGKLAGFMTLGSPIDKHVIMWPELWEGFAPASAVARAKPIKWRNYFDYGDPVGFALDSTRGWLEKNGWTGPAGKPGVFEFTAQHEYGFTRYPFPGKAHNDYWGDQGVFAHFISDVIAGGPAEPRPRSRPVPWVVSWIVPYVIAIGLLYGGVYVFYKSVAGFIGDDQTALTLLLNVSAVTCLMGGMTVMARMWRLAKWPWVVLGAAVFGLGIWAYTNLITTEVDQRLGRIFDSMFGWGRFALPGAAACVAAVAVVLGKLRPRAGLKPLVITTGLVAGAIAWDVLRAPHGEDPIWPVVLAGGGFLPLVSLGADF